MGLPFVPKSKEDNRLPYCTGNPRCYYANPKKEAKKRPAALDLREVGQMELPEGEKIMYIGSTSTHLYIYAVDKRGFQKVYTYMSQNV
jgi:hypothetical protein